jgi:hypothetical protein
LAKADSKLSGVALIRTATIPEPPLAGVDRNCRCRYCGK